MFSMLSTQSVGFMDASSKCSTIAFDVKTFYVLNMSCIFNTNNHLSCIGELWSWLKHLEHEHDNEVVIDDSFVSIAVSFLLSCAGSVKGNDGVKKHFEFPHSNSKIPFVLNVSSPNVNF